MNLTGELEYVFLPLDPDEHLQTFLDHRRLVFNPVSRNACFISLSSISMLVRITPPWCV